MPTRPVWRVRDRASFADLRRRGHRARRGPVTVTWIPPTEGDVAPPRLAFAIGRRSGGAVVRNRLRRRLRAIFVALPDVPGGAYLVSAGPEAASTAPAELTAALGEAVLAAAGQGTTPRRMP